jgi:hypothetical protein
MPVDLAVVAYVLSMIASTAKLLEFGAHLSHSPSKTEVDDVVKAAEAYSQTKFPLNSPSVIAMSKGRWSRQIIEVIREQLEETNSTIQKIIRNKSYSEQDRSERLRAERLRLCSLLAQIKNYSGGVFPADVQEEWDATCFDYIP